MSVSLRSRPSVARLSGLLSAVADGDDRALSSLYDITASRVFGLIVQIVPQRVVAEAAVQETYLHVWQFASRFQREGGHPMAWILHESHRCALERARAHGVASREARPSRDVRVAVAGLSDVQRESLLLSYYEGRTIHEIARRLDIPDDAVAAQIRVGLLKLQAETGN